MNIAFISPYEVDFQPIGILGPISYIRDQDIDADVHLFDLTKEDFDYTNASSFDAIFISVVVFPSVNEAILISDRLRTNNYAKPILFYNMYATVRPENFLKHNNSFVIIGEYEHTICDIIRDLANGGNISEIENVWDGKGTKPAPNFKKQKFLKPIRSHGNISLDKYLKTRDGKLIANVETARGCAHACNYCSVYAAFNRKVIRIPEEVVLEDIRQCVRAGAGHITFVDADFFSSGTHGLKILRQMHKNHPWLTFDLTCRVDDIVRKKELLGELKAMGCLEITSALEFPKQEVLEILDKGITVDQMRNAIRLLKDAGIRINPTFINFTPFIEEKDIELFNSFIREMELEGIIDPLQRETRLLLYKGSPLLNSPAMQGIELQEHDTFYDWVHPDPNVDIAYELMATPHTDGRRKKCCIKC